MSSLYENSLKDHLAEMKKFITLILLLTISVLLLHPRTSYCFEDSFELGIKYLNSGSYEDAIKAFSTTIETIPHDFVAISNRGIAFFYISKYDEAIKDYTRAITISPGFADAYCNRGVAWAAKGNTDNAIADYTKAIEINPNYSEAYYNRAASWAAKGNYGRAIADYTKDIESNPVYSKISEKNVSGYNDIIQRFSEVHFNRGLIFNAKGNYDPAISDFEKAIEINPLSAEAYFELSKILSSCPDSRHRNGKKAVLMARKGYGFIKNAESLDVLAAAYAEAGDFTAAKLIQKKAIKFLNNENESDNLSEYKAHLEHYNTGRPWHNELVAKKIIKRKKYKKIIHKAEKEVTTLYNKTGNKPDKSGYYPYTIQVCSLKDIKTSQRLTTQLRSAGEPAFTSPARIPETGVFYRVFIGFYGSYTEAKKEMNKLNNRMFKNAIIVKLPYTIQIGVFDKEHNMKDINSKLIHKGFIPYIIPLKNSEKRLRFLAGAFSSEKETSEQIKRLRGLSFNPEVVKR